MKKYETLEHRGDFKIRVFGKTKEDLFLNALLGMEAGLRPEQKTKNTKQKIKIQSLDLNALLVDFLSEALYLIQTNKEIYNDVVFQKLSDTSLEAELVGQKVERFGEEIKAVTYHGLEINQGEEGNWNAEILFDI